LPRAVLVEHSALNAVGEAEVGLDASVALPDDEEAAVGAHGDTGLELIARRVGIDLVVVALRDASGVESFHLHAVAGTVRSSAAERLPDDHERTVAVHGRPRVALVLGRVGVHLKLAADGRAIGGEALAVYAAEARVRAAAADTVPDHDEVTGLIGGDGGT
jgi:hypothetical protein